MIRKLLVLLLVASCPQLALAASCTAEVLSNDGMRFNVKNVDVSRTCEDFTIVLRHKGRMPARIMGHNVVISKLEDIKPVDRDGLRAGLKNDFVKPNDPRVIGYTKMIGGGETTSVTFKPAKIDGDDYWFFCSFPGHAARMRGTLTLVD